MVIPPVDPIAAATTIGPVALKMAKKQFKKYLSKDHGSKVKKGEFAEATIEMFGDKACIQLNKEGSQVLLLTSDNIQSYRYVDEKKRMGGKGLHTYFYYDIVFKDGSESYVRMRRKYRDAMLKYTN